MPLFHISKEAQKLVGLLIDYYEAGDCDCKAKRRIQGENAEPCYRCKIQDKLGNEKESVFDELRNELK